MSSSGIMLQRLVSTVKNLDLRPHSQRPTETSSILFPDPLFDLSSIKQLVVQDCIRSLRSDIFALQSRHNATKANILTITRIIKSLVQISAYDGSPAFLALENDIDSKLLLQIEAVSYTCTYEQPQRIPIEQPGSAGGLDIFNMNTLVEKPEYYRDMPYDVRYISRPQSVNPDYSDKEIHEETNPYIQLNLLYLKREEMIMEAETLERHLVFWADICIDLQSTPVSAEEKGSTESKFSIAPIVTRNSLPTPPNSRKNSESVNNTMQRKPVPIRDMAARLQIYKEARFETELRRDKSGIDTSEDV